MVLGAAEARVKRGRIRQVASDEERLPMRSRAPPMKRQPRHGSAVARDLGRSFSCFLSLADP